jgi:HD-GYP domain-containing protein (c-di-GMP phosphodiesterase class II)
LGVGLLALLSGMLLDFYVFSDMTLVIAYIPVMVIGGFLFRSTLSLVVLASVSTFLLYYQSPNEWSHELFLLRGFSYFFVAFIISSLLKNVQKEREYLVGLVSTLAESIDARDKYTAFHSKNVAYYSFEIAKAMNLSPKECDSIYIGGLLHDIGKIGVPEAILNKPSRLTSEEFEKIKKHPQIGYNMLKYIPYFRKNSILDVVLHHHEKFDGTGYPHGLKEENIPLMARIMAIADAFDAMTSRRVYRTEKDLDYALTEIMNGKASQFDPEIAEVFLELVRKNQIEIQHHQDGRDREHTL